MNEHPIMTRSILLMDERDDLIAWRAEDVAARRYGCAAIADEYIDKLSRRIDRLAGLEFDARIGLARGQRVGGGKRGDARSD